MKEKQRMGKWKTKEAVKVLDLSSSLDFIEYLYCVRNMSSYV